MWIPQWLARLIDKPCEHDNSELTEWTADDGTCMLSLRCRDCGFCDEGAVVGADPETWGKWKTSSPK